MVWPSRIHWPEARRTTKERSRLRRDLRRHGLVPRQLPGHPRPVRLRPANPRRGGAGHSATSGLALVVPILFASLLPLRLTAQEQRAELWLQVRIGSQYGLPVLVVSAQATTKADPYAMSVRVRTSGGSIERLNEAHRLARRGCVRHRRPDRHQHGQRPSAVFGAGRYDRRPNRLVLRQLELPMHRDATHGNRHHIRLQFTPEGTMKALEPPAISPTS